MEIYNAIIKLQKGDKTDDSAQVSPRFLSLSHSLSLSLSFNLCCWITSTFLGVDTSF
jgi:hypothetical protein